MQGRPIQVQNIAKWMVNEFACDAMCGWRHRQWYRCGAQNATNFERILIFCRRHSVPMPCTRCPCDCVGDECRMQNNASTARITNEFGCRACDCSAHRDYSLPRTTDKANRHSLMTATLQCAQCAVHILIYAMHFTESAVASSTGFIWCQLQMW